MPTTSGARRASRAPTAAARRARTAAALCAVLALAACGNAPAAAHRDAAGSPSPTRLPASPTHPASAFPTRSPSAPATATARPTFTDTALACAVPTSRWSTARLAAETITIPVQETAVGSISALVGDGFGGVILFGSAAPANLGAQLRALVGHAPAGIPPLVMTDEEGGGIQRMANLVGSLPWPRTMAETETLAGLTASVRSVAQRMRADGVDVDLAPVLDLNAGAGPNDSNPDGPRSFSANPQIATRYAQAFAAGLIDGGVLPVFKHFPGLGRATANTDVRTAYVPPLSSLESYDLIPFRAEIAAGAKAIMVSNAIITGTSGEPVVLTASLVTGLLRNQMHFRGLIVTDSLSAGAITDAGFGLDAAVVRAVSSGADLVLFGPTASNATPATALGMRNALAGAVGAGRLSRATLLAAADQVLAAAGRTTC